MVENIDVIRSYVAEHEEEMLRLLERVVRINSYTPNKSGTDAVAAVFREVMEGMGFRVRIDPQELVGDNLVAENVAASEGAKRVMLCGHMDTVFPEDMGFDCFERVGENIIGPGVIDMKGGLVVGIYALKALAHAGLLEDMPVSFLFNSDEEIGSPHSRPLVEEEARKACMAFVFECSNLGGELVTGRKGKVSFKVRTTGVAGHAGGLTGPKPSAILEMAHKTVAMEALNRPEDGVSVNVGLVNGGIGPNTVSPKAEAMVESRYVKASDGEQLKKDMIAIAENTVVPGTSCTVEIVPGRPPMETGNDIRKLYLVVEQVGADLNIPVGSEFRGGVSDANFIAKVGTPVLDGMGPAGARDHSPDEYMVVSSLAERAVLSAVSMRCAWDLHKAGNLF